MKAQRKVLENLTTSPACSLGSLGGSARGASLGKCREFYTLASKTQR